MAKAILVMEMPSSCLDCPCVYVQVSVGDVYQECKAITNTIDEDIDIEREKPTWCPLREVPQKHERGHSLKVAIENDCYDETKENDAWCEGHDEGYNACIDEIGGGE